MNPPDEPNRRDFLRLAGPGTLGAGAALAATAPAAAEQEKAAAQPKPAAPKLTDEQLRKGANLLAYEDPGTEDPMPLVKKYDGLRVTDVIDALQAIGLQDVGVMSHDIRPLWRDPTDKLAHRVYGVAITYQYVPTNRPPAAPLPYDQFKKWHSAWYRELAPEAFTRLLRPGTIVVIDAQGIDNTGFIGSFNALNWKSRGMAGVITNGGCRDTDELILQRIPVYSRYQGGGTRPGRIEAAAINRPVSVGGALVRPGDMVVADGDGVVVVPREHAAKVAEIAWEVAHSDKEARKKLYEKLGLPPDRTIK
jgi:4-hydroxy-4-methyl-2-oxoglutarate aldolase